MFTPFRFYVYEYVGCESHVKFEIFAKDAYLFDVRNPEFDYIKEYPSPCVEYNRAQLLCFLLTYDKKQCFDFMQKLYKHCGAEDKKINIRLSQIPIFKGFYREKEKGL